MNWQELKEKLLVPILLALLAASMKAYVDLQILKHDSEKTQAKLDSLQKNYYDILVQINDQLQNSKH